jgi:chromosome segregation ATPase
MKLSLVCFLFLLVSFFVTPQKALAQATASRPTSEQSLQELVREVRQLRATLQRINSSMYKGQVMIERLKLQQDQVARISRELAQIREELSEVRAHQLRFKEALTSMEAGVEAGTRKREELQDLKMQLETFRDREERMTAREMRLSHELELERAKLNDLNDRLNALELELTPGRP